MDDPSMFRDSYISSGFGLSQWWKFLEYHDNVNVPGLVQCKIVETKWIFSLHKSETVINSERK